MASRAIITTAAIATVTSTTMVLVLTSSFVRLLVPSDFISSTLVSPGSMASFSLIAATLPEEMVLITQSVKEVGQIMSTYVGIVRSDLRLKRAWDRLDLLYEETERLFKRSIASRQICELRNMINVGYLITRQAIERKESRGLHYTLDYPPVAHHQE